MKGKTKKLRVAYWALLTAFALLIVVGTVNVFSSTFVEDGMAGNVFGHLIRQVFIFAIGLIPAVFVYKKDYQYWDRHTRAIVIITVLLLLAVLTVGGRCQWGPPLGWHKQLYFPTVGTG
jgi:cell division protein FtsW